MAIDCCSPSCSQEGFTPLLVACNYHKYPLVKELIETGATVDTTTKVCEVCGKTGIYYACDQYL